MYSTLYTILWAMDGECIYTIWGHNSDVRGTCRSLYSVKYICIWCDMVSYSVQHFIFCPYTILWAVDGECIYTIWGHNSDVRGTCMSLYSVKYTCIWYHIVYSISCTVYMCLYNIVLAELDHTLIRYDFSSPPSDLHLFFE